MSEEAEQVSATLVTDKRASQMPTVVVGSDPDSMLSRAIDRGMDAGTIEKLLALKERYDAERAREAYVKAMAVVKAQPIVVKKAKRVRFTNRSGDVTDYKHATLAEVVDAAIPRLAQHGFSVSWQTKQDAGLITVDCLITHEGGHQTKTSLSGAPDESGGKNKIQAVGSTVSYLERYTLMAALGLAAQDQDNDGHGAGQPISAEQLAEIVKKVEDTGADKALFLEWLNVADLSEIPVVSFDGAMKQLEIVGRRKKERQQPKAPA